MENVWEKSLLVIKEKIKDHNYETWIKPLTLLAITDSSVEIEVPNKFFQDWLYDNYSELISDSLREVGKKEFDISFRVKKETGRHLKAAREKAALPAAEPQKADAPVQQIIKGFSNKYVFETFVTGSSNQFAMAASLAAAGNPGKTYNPLFLYGGVGLGKTHLLCAIGHYVLEKNNRAKVLYVTSEKFTNEVVNAIRLDKMTDFKARYREVDVLLIDDIQLLAGKERTQEEFFHTFNSLFESHKQIVIASDSFPKEIQKLDERLRSRFEWGLTADIQPPELELRVAILKRKADINALNIPDDVAFFMANHYQSNIRELEGAMISVGAFSSLTGEKMTVDLARKVLKINNENRILSIDDIQKAVAAHFNIKMGDLRSKRKIKSIAIPRQVAMYLSRTMTDASFPEIGREFGNKDHSTVIYAVKKIEGVLEKDPVIRKSVDTLSKKLRY